MMDPSSPQGSASHPPYPRDRDQGQKIINFSSPQRVRFAPQPSSPNSSSGRPSSRRGKASPLPPPPGPSIYWDDRNNDTTENLDHYTFYREGTPPPEAEAQDKESSQQRGAVNPVAEGSAAGGGNASDREYGQPEQSELGAWSVADSNVTNPAKSRRLLWIIVALGVLLLVGVAVGVGVGLGIGLKKTSESGDSKSSTSLEPIVADNSTTATLTISTVLAILPPSTSNPSSTTSFETTQTVDVTAGFTSSKPRPKYNSDCPALNNTVYHVPGSTRSFLRICGIDYGSEDGNAIDLGNVYTASMADCMHTCASFDQCTGCSWGYIEGDDVGGEHRCFMKKNLKKPHVAHPDWCFAILRE